MFNINDNTIQMNLFDYFFEDESFTVKEATNVVKKIKNLQVNNESIRARIYEGVECGIFKKVARGVYKVEKQIDGHSTQCLLINGDGRDLSMFNDKSIDGIITDHPYDIQKALTGGNRKFANYELFRYEKRDFEEKRRVLKDGAFLVEFLPEESDINYEYLYEIKKMAKECGFEYFAKVPWVKGDFVANTGRKSKNVEDVMIFSNGKARDLKLNAKKNLQTARQFGLEIKKGATSYQVKELLEENGLTVAYMSGTNGMLPTSFTYQPKNNKEKIIEAEKPVELLEEIIKYISKPYEILLDTFGGSGNFGKAVLNTQRYGIVIEKDESMFNKMINNVSALENSTFEYLDIIEREEQSQSKHLNTNNITQVDISHINAIMERYGFYIMDYGEFVELKMIDDSDHIVIGIECDGMQGFIELVYQNSKDLNLIQEPFNEAYPKWYMIKYENMLKELGSYIHEITLKSIEDIENDMEM